MLELLQARPLIGGAELARRLEVDQRSVRRYIVMLQDLGIPVAAVRGPGGGYQLRPGFKLPPLMFTDEEAVALALALLALPRLGLSATGPATVGALAKLERVLPAPVRARVQAIQAHVALDQPPAAVTADSDLVALFSVSAHRGQAVWLRYRASDGQVSERLIDPYGVAAWSRYWYVVGHCHLRGGPRLFRLDRVLVAEPRGADFTPPASFDVLAFIERAIGGIPAQWAVEVRLALPLAVAQRRVPAAYGELTADGSETRFRCQVDDLDGLAHYLVGLGCAFTVDQPAALRDALRRLARAIVVNAGGPPPAEPPVGPVDCWPAGR